MVGVVADRDSVSDYDADMQRAKSIGIDAFALNIGTDATTDTQLAYAYESAANNGMKLFISFDFAAASWTAADVGAKIAKYASEEAQLMVDGKVFASSFVGDGLDVSAMRAAAGLDVFWAPNFNPDTTKDPSEIDAALNWQAWQSDGANKAPKADANVTVLDGDDVYKAWLGEKPYIAPVSAWFSTHYGPEVAYSKNWVFPSDLLWYDRWNDVLAMGPEYLEIITWNDFGESHYIGPLSSVHGDDGNSKWANDMPHEGWMDLAKPFIAAYKAGATSVEDYIEDDQIIYWYRPTQKSLDCDATDTTMKMASNDSGNYFQGRPNGWETMQDAVFVVTLLKDAGSVTVNSGGNTETFDAPAGAMAFQVDMDVGAQSFILTRDDKEVLSGTSLKDVSDVCICGIYNFNAYVGVLPAAPVDPLGPAGLALLTDGLSVTTCHPTPSLDSVAAPAPTVITTAETSQLPSTTAGPTSQSSHSTTAPPPPTITPTTSSSSSTSTSQAPVPTTISVVVPSPTSSHASVAPTPTGASGNATCNGGTYAPGAEANLEGLCRFACTRGYCPEGPCVCTSNGNATAAVQSGVPGCPLSGEGDHFIGLCQFSCLRGYCPDTACTSSCG